MPACNKELKIFNRDHGEVAIVVECCKSVEHEGKHEAHIWTNAFNNATQSNGLIKIIEWEDEE